MDRGKLEALESLIQESRVAQARAHSSQTTFTHQPPNLPRSSPPPSTPPPTPSPYQMNHSNSGHSLQLGEGVGEGGEGSSSNQMAELQGLLAEAEVNGGGGVGVQDDSPWNHLLARTQANFESIDLASSFLDDSLFATQLPVLTEDNLAAAAKIAEDPLPSVTFLDAAAGEEGGGRNKAGATGWGRRSPELTSWSSGLELLPLEMTIGDLPAEPDPPLVGPTSAHHNRAFSASCAGNREFPGLVGAGGDESGGGEGSAAGGVPDSLFLPAQTPGRTSPFRGRSPVRAPRAGGRGSTLSPCLSPRKRSWGSDGGSLDSAASGGSEEWGNGQLTPNDSGGEGNDMSSPAQEGGDQLPRKQRQKRGTATDPHSVAAKDRRSRISVRMKKLHEMVPNANKGDTASMLEEAINYVRRLLEQVQRLSREKKRTDDVGNGEGGGAGVQYEDYEDDF